MGSSKALWAQNRPARLPKHCWHLLQIISDIVLWTSPTYVAIYFDHLFISVMSWCHNSVSTYIERLLKLWGPLFVESIHLLLNLKWQRLHPVNHLSVLENDGALHRFIMLTKNKTKRATFFLISFCFSLNSSNFFASSLMLCASCRCERLTCSISARKLTCRYFCARQET